MDELTSYQRWMTRCLELAQRGAGSVSPNPMVGCVIVGPEGELLGEGWHREFGGPHAEVHAIDDVERNRGNDRLSTATLVVNLEPCSHHGKTPPCADLLVRKGIQRVVLGMMDPNPLVAGSGIRRLRDAGVEVIENVLAPRCARLNEAFLKHTSTGRPLVVLKVAQSLDGRVATGSGRSRWISGEESRRLVHAIRATIDAVMVGSGSARSDDPSLTVRMVEGRHPWRVVLDREGSLPPGLKLFSDEHVANTIAVVGPGCTPRYKKELEHKGGTIIEVKFRGDHLDLSAVLAELGKGSPPNPPIQSILVEAGPSLAPALVSQGLVDRLLLFVAPKLIGGDGVASMADLGISRLSDAITFAEKKWEQVGDDILFTGFTVGAEDLVPTG